MALLSVEISANLLQQIYFGLNFSACCIKSSTLLPPASAIISNLSRSFSITSSAWVPIEPVEPIILIFLFFSIKILYYKQSIDYLSKHDIIITERRNSVSYTHLFGIKKRWSLQICRRKNRTKSGTCLSWQCRKTKRTWTGSFKYLRQICWIFWDWWSYNNKQICRWFNRAFQWLFRNRRKGWFSRQNQTSTGV